MASKATTPGGRATRRRRSGRPRRESRLQRLLTIQEALASDEAPGKAIAAILHEVALQLNVHLPVRFFRLNAAGDSFLLAYPRPLGSLRPASRPGSPAVLPGFPAAGLAPAVWEALSAGEPCVCVAPQELLASGVSVPHLEALLGDLRPRPALLLPVLIAGRPVAIVLVPLPGEAPPRRQIGQLKLLAGLLALALRHEQLLAAAATAGAGQPPKGGDGTGPRGGLQQLAQEVAAANRRLEALNGAARALGKRIDLEEVEQAIVAQAVEILRADAAALFMLGEAEDMCEVHAHHGLPPSYASRARVLGSSVRTLASPAADPISFFSAAQRVPRWVRRLLTVSGSRRLAALPLHREDQLLGLLVLLSRAGDPDPDFAQPELAIALGELATGALLKATHHRETEFGAAESTFLLQIVQLLASTFDVDAIVEMVVEEAGDLVESEVGALYLHDPLADAIQLRVLQGAPREQAEQAGLCELRLDHLPATRWAAAEGRTLASEWPGEGSLLSLFGPLLRLRTSLTVPLRARSELLGLLFLGRRKPRRFGPRESEAAIKLGALAALALDNARLYADLGRQMEELRATQAQLIEAEKMASLGRIVAGVAHALNNPLAVISGYAQMLLDSDLPLEMRDQLERIDRGARRAAEIVRELLAFARKRPILPTTIEVAALVRAAVERERAALQEAGIEVGVDVEPDLPRIQGDRIQLEQVLAHLIANARQAIGERPGAGHLTIGARYTGRLQLSVADDGLGIPADLLDKVFEPFLTTQEVGQGQGLGLAVCYGVVRAHSGRIWAANNPAAGATFYVELPPAE